MCVAILAPKGKVITPRQLFNGWTSNPHGAGLAYLDNDGKVQISKGFLNFDAFEADYIRKVEAFGTNGPMLVHMRIRSAGDMGRDNTHPFRIKNGAMIHNGTLFSPKRDPKSKYQKSDTALFAETLHNILTPEDVREAKSDLESAIYGSKLAFLWDGGETVIINERYGYWHDGIWYSNRTCGITEEKSTDKTAAKSSQES